MTGVEVVLAISAALAIFHQRRPPWRAIAAILAFGLAMRLWTWNAERDTLAYGFATSPATSWPRFWRRALRSRSTAPRLRLAG